MPVPIKDDANEIRRFLSELSAQDWIQRTERRVWPHYAFHYTDIRNASRILIDGALFSRREVESMGQLSVSSGSDEILEGTDPWVKDMVRLYFRPKTPTQYHAEGVKSQLMLSKSRFHDAHCPVPIFFLFDLADLLCMEATKFSDRGLGSHSPRILSTASELRTLDWAKIYHTGSVDPSTPHGREIIAQRNAEVFIPRQLSLEYLKYIYCRSEPELETLLFLLPFKTSRRYRSRILSSARAGLYYRLHTFLEDVRLDSESVTLSFSPETRSIGPYSLRWRFESITGEVLLEKQASEFEVKSKEGGFRWKIHAPATEYRMYVYLDDALIYANQYSDTDLPF